MKTSSLSTKHYWIYIVVAAMCMAATFPGRTHGLGLITESILRDLSLDRTVYAYYNLSATLIGALFCIPVGSMLDRSGCRKVLILVLIGLGISVLGMSATQNKPVFFILLLLTRGFGQSALSVASITLISKYFPKNKLGISMGIYSLLTSIFFMGIFGGMGIVLDHIRPLAFSFAGIETVIPSWRVAWGSVGLALLFFCVPVVLLSLRRSGWVADETAEIIETTEVATETIDTIKTIESIDTIETENPAPGNPDVEYGIPFSQAIRTAAFWVFALSISFFGLVSAGIGLYNEDILSERGFDANMYHFLLLLPIPFGLMSNLGVGLLTRYINIKYVLALSLFFTGLVKFLFPFIETPEQVYAYTIVLAISGGGLSVLFFIAWADLFGKRDVGKIQGIAQMLSVCASAAGPVFFAYSKEWTNSYTLAFYISGGLTILFAVAACLMSTPARKCRMNKNM
ncbi:MAG: MFS transporter [Tannerella sp.]|nr:MFS transporter [Tannerella sp.]